MRRKQGPEAINHARRNEWQKVRAASSTNTSSGSVKADSALAARANMVSNAPRALIALNTEWAFSAEFTSMQDISRCLLIAAILAVTLAHSAHAQGSAVYVTTYVEVMANAVAPGVSLLETYRDASRKQDGNLRFNVLQEIGRPNRFAITEAWRDPVALDAHAKAASTLQFRNNLTAIETAPYDDRINNALATKNGKNAAEPNTIYVVTHVDVLPAGKDDCIAALKAIAIESADDSGNISYDAFEQANRGNHFTVIEAWASEGALDGHAAAAHTRAFREKIMPFIGAPYDDRLYKALN
jgi:quinol monooxygenase YgiN